MVIEVTNIVKEYSKKRVVDDVSFEVYEGEIFGFLGRNGAGKSTIINMMTGIVRPTSGNICLFGKKKFRKQLQKRVGVLPDSSSLYPYLTAYQHMQFFSSLKGIKMNKTEAYALLERVGLEDDGKKISDFSLGMKKKLGIAQALIHQPQLLFLDEPTSTLDPESRIHICDMMQTLAQEGTTICMTSHNLEEVERICNRIAIMEKGKIKKMGSLSWLRKNAQSNLKVTMNAKAHPKDSEEYVSKVGNLGITIKATNSGFSLVVDTDELIPGLISLAINQNVRIYGVEAEKFSLEEIFLSR